MPRYVFSASSVTNTTGAPLRITFYATSTTGRRETDLWTVDGSNSLVERIPNGVILTDSVGGYSAFAGPDDVDTLYALPSNTSSRTALTASGSVPGGSAVDSATYVSLNPAVSSYTYNADGTVATETVGGVTTTYTYNGDGTVATSARAGVTRTYTYSAGNVTGIA